MKKTRNNRSWAIIMLLAITLQAQAQKLINLKLDELLLKIQPSDKRADIF